MSQWSDMEGSNLNPCIPETIQKAISGGDNMMIIVWWWWLHACRLLALWVYLLRLLAVCIHLIIYSASVCLWTVAMSLLLMSEELLRGCFKRTPVLCAHKQQIVVFHWSQCQTLASVTAVGWAITEAREHTLKQAFIWFGLLGEVRYYVRVVYCICHVVYPGRIASILLTIDPVAHQTAHQTVGLIWGVALCLIWVFNLLGLICLIQ